MRDLFNSKQEIQKSEFLERWRESETGSDQFALDNLKRHEDYNGLRYYVITLSENGLSNLILPYHNHVNNEVSVNGEPFWSVISKYWERFKIQDGKLDDCLQRVHRAKELIEQSDKSGGSILKAKFIFVSNDRKLAMPGDDHYRDRGENKLYVGNFHRFVAYGVWVKENYYKPIETYYCERE